MPSVFNGFTVTNDGVVVIGTNIAITGYVDEKEVFSFPVSYNTPYALSVNQNDNIVVYTNYGKFVFTKEGDLLTFSENHNVNVKELRKRQIIAKSDSTYFVLTNEYGINKVYKIENGEKTLQFRTSPTELIMDFSVIEAAALIVVIFIGGVFAVKKKKENETPEGLLFDEDGYIVPRTKRNQNRNKNQKKRESTEPRGFVLFPDFEKAFSKPEQPVFRENLYYDEKGNKIEKSSLKNNVNEQENETQDS